MQGRARGRKGERKTHHITSYHNGIWRIFIECGKKPHARKSAQGRSARGPILPKSNRNFRQPPHTNFSLDRLTSIEASKMSGMPLYESDGNELLCKTVRP